jgi:RHS repeat-associated protein
LTYFTSGGSGDAGDQYTGLDRFGRVVDQRWRKTSDNTDRERVKYGFDRASNRQWRQNTVAATLQDEYYTYDGLYQVKNLDRGTLNAGKTAISGTPTWEEDWDYDPTGNWRGATTAYLTKVNGATTLNQNRSHNVANEINNITTASGTIWPVPIHDAAGNMTKVPQPLSLANAYDLKWDAWNRLVEVKVTGGSVVATYRYDGANRRVTKTVGANTRHYYYSDQWQILEERLNATTTADRRFVWGLRYADDLVLRDRGAERFYVLHDYFNPTALIDTTGTVQERYGYDGFGAPHYMTAAFGSRATSSYEWETLYGAYRYDLESGLYQVRYRYLHPKLGRWISRDPIEEIHFIRSGLVLADRFQETNLYAYVKNRFSTFVDPKGLVMSPQIIIWCARQPGYDVVKCTCLFVAPEPDPSECEKKVGNCLRALQGQKASQACACLCQSIEDTQAQADCFKICDAIKECEKKKKKEDQEKPLPDSSIPHPPSKQPRPTPPLHRR